MSVIVSLVDGTKQLSDWRQPPAQQNRHTWLIHLYNAHSNTTTTVWLCSNAAKTRNPL